MSATVEIWLRESLLGPKKIFLHSKVAGDEVAVVVRDALRSMRSSLMAPAFPAEGLAAVMMVSLFNAAPARQRGLIDAMHRFAIGLEPVGCDRATVVFDCDTVRVGIRAQHRHGRGAIAGWYDVDTFLAMPRPEVILSLG